MTALVRTFVFLITFGTCLSDSFGQTVFQEDNLLVTVNNPENIFMGLGELREYDRAGSLVQSIDIPTAFGLVGSQTIFDVDVDELGRAVVQQDIGGGVRVISTYDSIVGVWTHQPFGTLSGSNTGSGSALSGDLIFTGGNRLDLSTGTLSNFSTAAGGLLADISIGLDGLLYGTQGLSPNSQLFVFDPETLVQVDSFQLSLPLTTPGGSRESTRGIAVNADGDIFSASQSGRIRQFDRDGQLVDDLLPADFGIGLSDIVLSPDGTIALTSTSTRNSTFQQLFLTDESLSSATSFEIEDSTSSSGFRVAFARQVVAVPEPSCLLLLAFCAVSSITVRRRTA